MADAPSELAPLHEHDAALFRDLPMPGSGRTRERFRALWEIAARSPSLGRLGEAHHDAIAIIEEAGRPADPQEMHAVWAAGGPDPLRLEPRGATWQLIGSKQWCSGATLARRALVTADAADGGGALVLVDLARAGVRIGESDWESPAMIAVDTRTVEFDLEVDRGDIVGVDDWYLERPGFWHGSVGVAACWAGCADGIVRRLESRWKDEPHALAHLGAIGALRWNLRGMIDAAADEIDAEPIGDAESRRRRALRVRHLVDVSVAEITTRIARALGPGPLAHLPDLHRHLAETDLYRRQSHAERDLEELGRLDR